MATVTLALPTYDGRVTLPTLYAVLQASATHDVDIAGNECSLLGHGFNQLWCHALHQKSDWFAMLHADVAPTDIGWLDAMIAAADLHEADILSAVVPIKAPPQSSQFGQTSTCWIPAGGEEPIHVLIQELPGLPTIFGSEELSQLHPGQTGMIGINTGCFIARLRDRTWPLHISFDVSTRIDWDSHPPTCRVLSEDWRFSQQAQRLSARVLAMQLPLLHRGTADWTYQLQSTRTHDNSRQTMESPT